MDSLLIGYISFIVILLFIAWIMAILPVRLFCKFIVRPFNEMYLVLVSILIFIAFGELIGYVSSLDLGEAYSQFRPIEHFKSLTIDDKFSLSVYSLIGLYFVFLIFHTLYSMILMGFQHTHLSDDVYGRIVYGTVALDVISFGLSINAYVSHTYEESLVFFLLGGMILYAVLSKGLGRIMEDSTDRRILINHVRPKHQITIMQSIFVILFTLITYSFYRFDHGAISSLALTYSSYYILSLLFNGFSTKTAQSRL